jgi:hypothetical protein
MIPVLRGLARRRHLLIARSAAQRDEIAAALQSGVVRLTAADRMIAGLRRVLHWAVRLVPLYLLLRRI